MLKQKKGFTLVELSIVLIIVGLLLGSGISMFTMLTKRMKMNEEKKQLDAIRTSLVSYAAVQKKLPDNETATSPDTMSLAYFASVAGADNDSYHQPYRYVIARELTTGGNVCTKNSTELKLRICQNAACSSSVLVDNVSFVVIGSGENRQFDGLSIGPDTQNAGVTQSTTTVYAPARTDAQDYDDIWAYATLNEVKGTTDCRDSALRVINTELPYAVSGAATGYSATVYGAGGVGTNRRWCYTVNTTPTNLNIRVNGVNLISSASCATTGTGSWSIAAANAGVALTSSGTAVAAGVYQLTFHVADEDDIIASKTLLLTVNP